MLFLTTNLFLLFINSMLFLMVYPEANAIVSYDFVLSKLFGFHIGYVFTLFLLSSLLFIIPILLITMTLCFMKKYFNLQNQKCPSKSFETITSILICSYNIWLLIEIFLFFTKLGASDSYYYFVRISSILDVFYSYYIMFDIIQGLLIHIVTFLILFSLLELSITYKFVSIFSVYTPTEAENTPTGNNPIENTPTVNNPIENTPTVNNPIENTPTGNNNNPVGNNNPIDIPTDNTLNSPLNNTLNSTLNNGYSLFNGNNLNRLTQNTFYRFLIKCKKLLFLIGFIISFYIIIIILSNLLMSNIGADLEKISSQIFSRLIHSFFLNSFTLYIYFIFINEGVLSS